MVLYLMITRTPPLTIRMKLTTIGKLRYSPETLQRFKQRLSTEDKQKEQSVGQRELQVLKLVAKGLTNKEIAETLFISQRTVQSHLTNIFNKLGTSSRIQAIFKA
jgi:DNA-binding NarL/FixJ family response regulator